MRRCAGCAPCVTAPPSLRPSALPFWPCPLYPDRNAVPGRVTGASCPSGLLFSLSLFQSALTLVPVALILVPLLTLVANIFDRRGSFGVVITQEYTAVASVVFYVLAAVNLATTLIVVVLSTSPASRPSYVADAIQTAPRVRENVSFLRTRV